MLDQELKFYQDNLPKWLQNHLGKYVVVKGEKLIGFFDQYEQALSEGARRFGLTSFLARKIEPAQEDIFIPALTLGLLNGNSTFSSDSSKKDS